MQGIQKMKCTKCGTMFMSETGNATCPSCMELAHGSDRADGNSGMAGGGGGCGCGHSH
jgi:hypothetical protein